MLIAGPGSQVMVKWMVPCGQWPGAGSMPHCVRTPIPTRTPSLSLSLRLQLTAVISERQVYTRHWILMTCSIAGRSRGSENETESAVANWQAMEAGLPSADGAMDFPSLYFHEGDQQHQDRRVCLFIYLQ